LASLKAAFWNYDRTLPLKEGAVGIEGHTLEVETHRPEVIFARAMETAEYDLCELSFSNSLTAISRGEFAYTLVPVFLARAFRHSSLIVRVGRGISRIEDLRGKIVGLQEYGMTAAVVIRGLLRDHGISPSELRWRVGEKQYAKPIEFPSGTSPQGLDISMLSPDASLEERLNRGELDAAVLTRRPKSLDDANSKIAPLFSNARVAEQEWFLKTKIFPIVHVLGVRKALLKSDPKLGRRVFNAFERAKEIAVSELEMTQAPKVTLPWPHAAVAEARSIMGTDFWPYGIRANRHVIETQINWSRLDGLQAKPVSLTDLFAEDCLDT
jgi:4,5-dihydroxyphthalate decarboxylase